MKNLALFCAALLTTCGLMSAQNEPDVMRVHFPTAVVAGETTIPAGDATIQVMESNNGSRIMVIRSSNGPHASVLVSLLNDLTPEANHGANVKLDHRGNDLVLDTVWMSDTRGFAVIK